LKYLLISVVFSILCGCVSTEVTEKKTTEEVIVQEEKEPTYQQKVYYLQHKVLPQWTHESEGKFLYDLMNDDLSQLKEVASDFISPEYAENITVKNIDGRNLAIIIFPQPKFPTHCFFVLIRRNEDSFYYTTYEKPSMFFTDDNDFVGVVGGWSSEGSHLNFGPRSYSDLDSFIKDMVK
jgi:hypothetical protein